MISTGLLIAGVTLTIPPIFLTTVYFIAPKRWTEGSNLLGIFGYAVAPSLCYLGAAAAHYLGK